MIGFHWVSCRLDPDIQPMSGIPHILPPALGTAREWHPGHQRAWSMSMTMHDPGMLTLGSSGPSCVTVWNHNVSGGRPGGGHGNPLGYSCLENPMDREGWWATIHRVAESDVTEATEQACIFTAPLSPSLWT